jgi:hypothetical protein
MSSQHTEDEIKTELIGELRGLAEQIGHTPAQSDMNQQGTYGVSVYEGRFGTWNNAIRAADLELNAQANAERGKSKSELLDELTRLADKLNQPPKSRDMAKQGAYGVSTYEREFDIWNEALREAGLEVRKVHTVSESDLLDELVRLTNELGEVPRVPDMREEGGYGVKVYQRKFGSWNDAIKQADLEVRREMDVSKSVLLNELVRLSEELGRTPSKQDMAQYGLFTAGPYYNQFGLWNDALREAGLEVRKVHTVSKSELLDELRTVADELGRAPTMAEMDCEGKYSAGIYQIKFESWTEGIMEAGLDPNNVHFPDHLDHKVRSTYEEEIANILLDEDITYEYESLVFEYGDGRTYTPDFVTDQYVIEVKGYVYDNEAEKAKIAMEQLTDKQYVVIQNKGEKLPADRHIQWSEREKLRQLL